LLHATAIALAASGCGRQLDLGEITQGLDEDGSEPAAGSRPLDGAVLLSSIDDIDVTVSDAAIWPPAATTDILPIALGDVDGDGLGDWIQGDTLMYGAPRPAGATLQVGGKARFLFEGDGTFRAAGDVNGDGLNDILFGAENTVWIASRDLEPVRELPVEQPPARLVLGSRERLTGDVALASLGIAFGDRDALEQRFAAEFASDLPDSYARQTTLLVPLGDIEGDGFADFVSTTTVAYTHHRISPDGWVGEDEIRAERVSYVHHGGADLLEVAAPRARLDANVHWVRVGDVDGDGLGDVVWSALGSFHLLSGRALAAGGELGLEQAVAVEGIAPAFYYADSPSDGLTGALGDLDGDGFDDFALNAAIVVTSPKDVSTPWFLFYGGPDLLEGPVAMQRAGAFFETEVYSTIKAVGDWDDDGYADLLLSRDIWLPGSDWGGSLADGREAVLLRGGAERFSGYYFVPPQRAVVEDQGTLMEFVPVPAGDLDGDGFADLFVKSLYATSVLDLGIVYGAPLPLPVVR
jgi:hypothetical protein